MKKILLFTGLFLSLFASAQNFVVEEVGLEKILYRGFENSVYIHALKKNLIDFELDPVNCEIISTESIESNLYILKPVGRAKTATLCFVSGDKIIDSVHFVVQPLPTPNLYWGNQAHGMGFSDSPELTLRYATGVAFKNDFRIISWKAASGDEYFSGRGAILSEAFLSHASSTAKGSSITITVTFVSADGVARKMAGVWHK